MEKNEDGFTGLFGATKWLQHIPRKKLLMEVKIFTRICHELSEIFRARYTDYLRLFKSKEDSMCGTQIMQEMVKNILSTGEYTLEGIEKHNRIPLEILSDLASGLNTNPTFVLSRKLLELHYCKSSTV